MLLLFLTTNNNVTRHITSSIAVNWWHTPSHTNELGFVAFSKVNIPNITCTNMSKSKVVLNLLKNGLTARVAERK